ncbi:MAG: hypothetical protein RJA57_1999, partial [Bacteroidota bacterium]
QGPDFLNARVVMGAATWAGSVEIHLRSSDWLRHGHSGDRLYENVVLHVVWENDRVAGNSPVLELSGRVPRLLLQRYEQMRTGDRSIPCGWGIGSVTTLVRNGWFQRLMTERMIRRSDIILGQLRSSGGDWESVCWWSLARTFGAGVNADAFEELARSISLRLLLRRRGQLHQLEALLMGQAGLLPDPPPDAYARMLQEEYRTLAERYGLQPIRQSLHFLRMRPAHFPTIRLAQLAMLLHRNEGLFSLIRDADRTAEMIPVLSVAASDYWTSHYRFGRSAYHTVKVPGRSMVNNLIINVIVPLRFAYGTAIQNESDREKALAWLEELPAEDNRVLRMFRNLLIPAVSAADSQALLELFNNYCSEKHCLSCAIGNWLLRRSCRSGQDHAPQSTVTSISG